MARAGVTPQAVAGASDIPDVSPKAVQPARVNAPAAPLAEGEITVAVGGILLDDSTERSVVESICQGPPKVEDAEVAEARRISVDSQGSTANRVDHGPSDDQGTPANLADSGKLLHSRPRQYMMLTCTVRVAKKALPCQIPTKLRSSLLSSLLRHWSTHNRVAGGQMHISNSRL